MTPEATQSLNDYFKSRKLNGEILTDDSPIFINITDNRNSKGEAITLKSIDEMLSRTIKNAVIERTKVSRDIGKKTHTIHVIDSKRFNKSRSYSLRKRFNGILKMNNQVNSNIAEKLMQHKRGLDGVYLQPTREECFTEFKKAIPELTVDPSIRQQAKIKELEIEKTELEQKNARIEELEKRFNKEIKADTEHKKEVSEFLRRIETPEGRREIAREVDEMLKEKPKRDMIKDLVAKKPKDVRFDIDALIKKRNLDN